MRGLKKYKAILQKQNAFKTLAGVFAIAIASAVLYVAYVAFEKQQISKLQNAKLYELIYQKDLDALLKIVKYADEESVRKDALAKIISIQNNPRELAGLSSFAKELGLYSALQTKLSELKEKDLSEQELVSMSATYADGKITVTIQNKSNEEMKILMAPAELALKTQDGKVVRRVKIHSKKRLKQVGAKFEPSFVRFAIQSGESKTISFDFTPPSYPKYNQLILSYSAKTNAWSKEGYKTIYIR